MDLNTLKYLLPFLNEISNVLTISKITPGLYLHNPINSYNIITKLIIDFLSLFGIIWNCCQETLNYNDINYGFKKALVLLLFAFLLPNILMEYLMKLIPINNEFISGMIVIILLLLIETFVYKRLIKQKNNNKEDKNNIKEE
mgnify:FL=1